MLVYIKYSKKYGSFLHNKKNNQSIDLKIIKSIESASANTIPMDDLLITDMPIIH